LSKEDRAALAVPLADILATLHFELLRAVYDRYPALKPSQEAAVVSSFLRWDDVSLPDSVSCLAPASRRWLNLIASIAKAIFVNGAIARYG
jgi:hypothetical protein